MTALQTSRLSRNASKADPKVTGKMPWLQRAAHRGLQTSRRAAVAFSREVNRAEEGSEAPRIYPTFSVAPDIDKFLDVYLLLDTSIHDTDDEELGNGITEVEGGKTEDESDR
ncbi:hypothetical protein FRC09_003687 [Ceratobasidium sp. 395]|nr:hypothetical protein FRC09_003687 [Ceratobasidium sp. 395]